MYSSLHGVVATSGTSSMSNNCSTSLCILKCNNSEHQTSNLKLDGVKDIPNNTRLLLSPPLIGAVESSKTWSGHGHLFTGILWVCKRNNIFEFCEGNPKCTYRDASTATYICFNQRSIFEDDQVYPSYSQCMYLWTTRSVFYQLFSICRPGEWPKSGHSIAV